MNELTLPRAMTCGYCDSSEFGSLKTSPQRVSSRFEIEYYLQDGQETYLNGETIPIRADRILIARPGDVRYSRLPFRTAYLKFSAEGELADLLHAAPRTFAAIHKKQILELLHEVIVLSERRERDSLLLSGKLLTLLSVILSDGRRELRGGGVNRQLLHSAKQYIEAHYSQRLSTAEIAQHIDLSESRFRVLFEAAYGISPHRYLTDVRICAAKEMLWNTAIPLTEIAEKCGFGSQQYLSDSFKRTVGVSPGKYRAQFVKRYSDEQL